MTKHGSQTSRHYPGQGNTQEPGNIDRESSLSYIEYDGQRTRPPAHFPDYIGAPHIADANFTDINTLSIPGNNISGREGTQQITDYYRCAFQQDDNTLP